MDAAAIVAFWKRYMDVVEQNNIIGFNVEGVHYDERFFRKTFPDYSVSLMRSANYPYRLSIRVDGVEFFCLSAKE